MRSWNLKGRENEDAPVVVLTTSETATSWVFAVLSDTTVTGGDVSAVLASLREPCRHFLNNQRKKPYVSHSSSFQHQQQHINSICAREVHRRESSNPTPIDPAPKSSSP